MCILSRRTGKMIDSKTLDLGSGGMSIHTTRPLAVDELPEYARINGKARVLREQAYRVYAPRFGRPEDEARAEIATLAGAASPPAPAR